MAAPVFFMIDSEREFFIRGRNSTLAVGAAGRGRTQFSPSVAERRLPHSKSQKTTTKA
jgi:hypothetical protein